MSLERSEIPRVDIDRLQDKCAGALLCIAAMLAGLSFFQRPGKYATALSGWATRVGVASVWRWLRRGSAQSSRYDGTPARFVPAGDQIEWAGLLLVATASVVLFGAVELRFLASIELSLFCLAGLALMRRVRRDLPILNLHRAATPLLAILGLAAVQLVPLPTSLTYALSPGAVAIRVAENPGLVVSPPHLEQSRRRPAPGILVRDATGRAQGGRRLRVLATARGEDPDASVSRS